MTNVTKARKIIKTRRKIRKVALLAFLFFGFLAAEFTILVGHNLTQKGF